MEKDLQSPSCSRAIFNQGYSALYSLVLCGVFSGWILALGLKQQDTKSKSAGIPEAEGCRAIPASQLSLSLSSAWEEGRRCCCCCGSLVPWEQRDNLPASPLTSFSVVLLLLTSMGRSFWSGRACCVPGLGWGKPGTPPRATSLGLQLPPAGTSVCSSESSGHGRGEILFGDDFWQPFPVAAGDWKPLPLVTSAPRLRLFYNLFKMLFPPVLSRYEEC